MPEALEIEQEINTKREVNKLLDSIDLLMVARYSDIFKDNRCHFVIDEKDEHCQIMYIMVEGYCAISYSIRDMLVPNIYPVADSKLERIIGDWVQEKLDVKVYRTYFMEDLSDDYFPMDSAGKNWKCSKVN